MTPSVLAHAIRLAANGFRVFPLHAKLPAIKRWPELASMDPAQIRDWWRKWPGANVGIATSSQRFVLDVDPRHGGIEALAAFIDAHGNLPDTPQVRTGSGGFHYYLAANESIRNSASKLGPGLDIRGDGGFVVAPPSLIPGKDRYVWIIDPRTPIAPAPEWLLAPLRPVAHAPVFPTRTASDQSADVKRATAYLARLGGAIQGQNGSTATFNAAVKLVRGFRLDSETAYSLLASEYNPKCQPPWSERELRHKVNDAQEKSRAEFGFLSNQSRPAPARRSGRQ